MFRALFSRSSRTCTKTATSSGKSYRDARLNPAIRATAISQCSLSKARVRSLQSSFRLITTLAGVMSCGCSISFTSADKGEQNRTRSKFPERSHVRNSKLWTATLSHHPFPSKCKHIKRHPAFLSRLAILILATF